MSEPEKYTLQDQITDELSSLADERFRAFLLPLIPTVENLHVIGVRVPSIRKIAKDLFKKEKYKTFLSVLPHVYYEENVLHSLILSLLPYDECVSEILRFLPYIDNWSVCDLLRPKCFSVARERAKMFAFFAKLTEQGNPYAVRFGLEMLMLHFLDADFIERTLSLAESIQSEHYYVNMMLAWLFAEAIIKNQNAAMSYIAESRLSAWVHNKTISKVRESLVPSEELKNTILKYKRDLKGNETPRVK